MLPAQLGETLAGLLSGLTRELERGAGPVVWCRTCGRRHGRRQGCRLVPVMVPAKSGRMVCRHVHADRVG